LLKSNKNRERADIYFGLFFITALFVGFLGILNSGGEHNVLLPIAAACGLYLPLITSELALERKYAKLSIWILPIQLALLASYPWKEPVNITNDVTKKRHEEYFRLASSLPGNVWIPSHGYTRKYFPNRTYAVIDQLGDVILVGGSIAKQFQYDIDTAFNNRHWDWIVSDFHVTYPHYQCVATISNYNRIEIKDSVLFFLYKPDQ
jgi:hypothetical protein